MGAWLAVWALMVALTVVIGGVTRLTESGLSITEWRPVTGVLPPLTPSAWEAEFAKYREIPEYRIEHPNLSLAGFQRIYLIEYVHRLWARLTGLALALPLALGLWRGWFSRPIRRRLLVLLVLTGLQGAMGWYMVRSGLAERTDVSQYRLAAHLALALAIFMMALWTAADLRARGAGGGTPAVASRGLRRHAALATGLIFLTALAGAFVAGTNAGKVYNEFPLMAGRVVPAGYLALDPWYRNLFDNVAAVQFNHRVLAVVLLLVAGTLALRLARSPWGPSIRRLGLGLGLAVAAQFGLGLLTLLGSVPLVVAVLHQAGAVALLGLGVLAVHGLAAPSPSR